MILPDKPRFTTTKAVLLWFALLTAAVTIYSLVGHTAN